MSARLMVLGVMAQKNETHGYDILREIMSWKADTWSTIRSGSVYHAITQLEKEGFLQKGITHKSKDGPAKTSYTLTPQGSDELRSLIEHALVSLDQEHFAAGLAFMHILPRYKVVGLAELRLKQYQEITDFMAALPQEENPTTPAKHPEIIGSWSAIFTATLSWQKIFIEHLKSGRYEFADEKQLK